MAVPLNPAETSERSDVADRLTDAEFAAMFQASSRTLWCIAAAVLGDRSQADDALQEAAMIAFQKLGDFRPGTSFAAWMGQIVRNVARNLARRRGRGAAIDIDVAEPIGDDNGTGGPSPVTARGGVRDDQESFDDHVLQALESLGATARACLLLRTVLDTPYHEIARILDVPEGTAMSHVHRARQEMRRRLQENTTRPEPDPEPESESESRP